MGFISNQTEIQGGIKPVGDYECIIKSVEEKVTKNGAKGLNFKFLIRNDVDGQKYGNAYLFHTIWRKKEPSALDNQVEGYNFNQLMALGSAAKLENGKEYDTLQAYLNELLDKYIRVTLKHEEYNGQTQERVNYINPTKHPKGEIQVDSNEFEEILSNDDAPF